MQELVPIATAAPTGSGGDAVAPAPPAAQPVPVPESPADAERRGERQLRAGDPVAAEATFRAAIARDPAVAGLHAALARCLAEAKRLEEAIAAAQEAARLAPGDPGTHALLGNLLLRAERPAECEAAARRSLSLRDNDTGVLHLLGIALDRQRRYPEAVAVAERIAELDPGNPGILSRILSLRSLDGDFAGMERAARAAIARHPGDAGFHRSLIAALDRQGRNEALSEAIRAAAAAAPDDPALADQTGTLMMARERWADAEAAFRKAAAAWPDNFGVFHKLSIAQERQGKAAGAIEAAERASQLAPANHDLTLRLATMRMNARQFAAAEPVLRRLAQARPADVRARHMLSVALERQRRFPEALEEAIAARALDPRDRGLQGHVVSLEAKCSRGRPDAARTYLVFVATGVGLGHLMGAVLGSAYYAWETGRAFCMDMREVLYFGQGAHDAFFEHFRLVVPDGLEVIADLDAIEEIRRDPDLFYLQLATPLEIERPFPNKVLMVPCITPGDPFGGAAVRRADEPFRIELRGRLAEALARSMARPEWGGPGRRRHVIGLHYRASVGELYDRMSPLNVPDYEERYAAVKDGYVSQAMRLAAGRDPDGFACFVASDDRAFVKEMLARLPNAFAFDSLRMDQYFQAQVLANKHDISLLVDAVTDLWALSQCQELIHTRSAFTHFAIMNSAHLDDSNTFYIHMPMFEEVLDGMAPEAAVRWARTVVRRIDASRTVFDKLHRGLARALRRAGLGDEADICARRAKWLFEMAHSPEVATPDAFAEREQRRRGNNDLAVQRARRAIAAMPGNPYLRAGYGGSLSTLLRQRGELPAATAAAREAVGLDPLDPFLHDHLGCLLAIAGDAEAAVASIRKALDIAPDVAAFHANLSACHAMRGAMPAAAAAARRAAELDPENQGHRARCEALALVQRVTMLA